MSENRSRAARVVAEATPHYLEARRRGLMHVTLEKRDGKRVTLPGGRTVTEFINCSYLGLDTHPGVVRAAQKVVEDWGVHFCCARSRFSIGPNRELEEALGSWMGGRAITFPSVTATHLSVMPLLASGALYGDGQPMRLVFDRFAHASMASLKAMLREHARVETIEHNDLDALETQMQDARSVGERPVYIADSVYSMGGRCPLTEVLSLAQRYDARLYLDDAHGTSIFGPQGQGPVFEALGGKIPEHVVFTYSLSKGFGTNGGGVLLPTRAQEDVVRLFGQTYAFSASLDFSIIAAAQASLALHVDGTVERLQRTLRERVALFDSLVPGRQEGFSPIRMVRMRTPEHALDVAERLIGLGYFVTVAMFPVVPRDAPQLRLCLSVGHSEGDIRGLVAALKEAGA
ncbi:MAG: aminotransferase class I/II-fold pyridoxal phosphate-dependent enzyme [Myxococcota bacterium]